MKQKLLKTMNRVSGVYRALFPIVMCVSLAACGDSSGGLEKNTMSKPIFDETVRAFVPTKALTSMPDFLFKAESELNIVVLKDGGLSGVQRVSLCHVGKRNTPDYDNCLFSGAISSAGFSRSLPIGNDVNELAFVHWINNAKGVSVVDTWHRGEGSFWIVYLSDVGSVSF